MFELSQTFTFDAAHTLKRAVSPEEAASSRRIHGHTYTAEVVLRGQRDAATGMVVDLALLRACLAQVRSQLDHHFLDEVPGLGTPTLENLCVFIARQVQAHDLLLAAGTAGGTARLASVAVWRAAGDRCTYRLASAP